MWLLHPANTTRSDVTFRQLLVQSIHESMTQKIDSTFGGRPEGIPCSGRGGVDGPFDEVTTVSCSSPTDTMVVLSSRGMSLT